MDFCSEIAILQSTWKYASKKIDKDLTSLSKDESTELIEIIHGTIKDIVEGLEDNHTKFQQKWWNTKLHSICLYKTQETDLTSKTHSSLALIGCHLPIISFDTYFELVKTCDWFESFIEISCHLEMKSRWMLYHRALHHVQQSPVNHCDLRLISSLIGHFILLWINHQPIIVECLLEYIVDTELESNFEELLDKLLNVVCMHSDQIKFLKVEVLLEFVYKLFILILLQEPCDRNFITRTSTEHVTDKNMVKSPTFCTSTSDLENSKMLKSERYPSVMWVKGMTLLLDVLQGTCVTNVASLFNKQFYQIAGFNINMEHVFKKVIVTGDSMLNNLPSDLLEEWKKIVHMVQEIVEKKQELSVGETMKQSEGDVPFSSVYCIRRILEKQTGFEDDIERLLTNSDLDYWNSEGYLDALLNNPCVFYKENHLSRLLHFHGNSYQHNPHNNHLHIKFSKLIGLVFRSQPLLLQQKLIIESYQQTTTAGLMIEDFSSELTVTFNRFTNKSSKQVIHDVSFLMLVDLKATMKRLVDTVISNPGQIDTVIQILQSLPDVCRCHHLKLHPDMSLLVTSINESLQSSEINPTQEKNLIKFISLIIQDYKYEIVDGHSIIESTPLVVIEVIKLCILPFFHYEALYTDSQPITLEFTFKLFTSILEKSIKDKSCHWLSEINPLVILLLIGEIHHECVQPLVTNEFNGRRMVIRQLIHKLLVTLKNVLRRNSYHLEGSHVDWFMAELDERDWVVKLVLHKFVTNFMNPGNLIHKTLLMDLVKSVLSEIEQNPRPLIQLSLIDEETLHTVLKYLPDQTSIVLPTDLLIATLSQMLPGLLSNEWMRIYQLLSTIITCNIIHVPLRLLYLDKILPHHLQDVTSALVFQVLNECILMTSSMVSDDVIHHIIRCYTGLIQTITGQAQSTRPKQEINMLLLGQIFGHVCITMTMVAMECQDTLFVCLLDILGKVKDLVSTFQLNSNYRSSFFQAVRCVTDDNMQKTLSKRLSEIFVYYYQDSNQ